MAGIIKAGDGRSGARARDGEGGNDGWAGSSRGSDGVIRENIRHLYLGDGNSHEYLANVNANPGYTNPTQGTSGGTAGTGGASGTVYNESISLDSNDSKSLTSKSGEKGLDGNTGWHGVNMLQYVDFRHWGRYHKIYDLNTIVSDVVTNGGQTVKVSLNIKFEKASDIGGQNKYEFETIDGWVVINCRIARTYAGNATIDLGALVPDNLNGCTKSGNNGYINVDNKILVLAYKFAKYNSDWYGRVWIKDCEKRFIVIDEPKSAVLKDYSTLSI